MFTEKTRDKIVALWGKPPETGPEIVQACFNYLREPDVVKKNSGVYPVRLAVDARVCSTGISTSHNSPLGWERRPGRRDEMLPGMYGQVWMVLNKRGGIDSLRTSHVGLWSGTGGAGSYDYDRYFGNYTTVRHFQRVMNEPEFYQLAQEAGVADWYPLSYDVKIWLDDWPALDSEISRIVTWERLRNNPRPKYEFTYTAQDPLLVEYQNKLLEMEGQTQWMTTA